LTQACSQQASSTGSEAKKQFFFEKKNQKTFTYEGQHLIGPAAQTFDATGKSFLLLFFKKEVLLFFLFNYSSRFNRIKNAGLLLCTAAWYRAGD